MTTLKFCIAIFYFSFGIISCQQTRDAYFDAYRATELTTQELLAYQSSNTTTYCVTKINLPCDPNAYKRVDGSCNYLSNPVIGAVHTPFRRLLPADYSAGYEPRLSKSGKPLELPRVLRTGLLGDKRISDLKLTSVSANILLFLISDIVSTHDTSNYAITRPYCCKPEGRSDPFCTPNVIPDDDRVFRYSGEKCMNMTKILTYQNQGCAPSNTVPIRVNKANVFYDVEIVYGQSESVLNNYRTFENGRLRYEIDSKGREWPPSNNTGVCIGNKPNETRCNDVPYPTMNAIYSVNLMSIWFWRQHNSFALNLAKINPHWNDQKLFDVARDINIASFSQILIYGLVPSLFGKANAQKAGIISTSNGFRDLYDSTLLPQTSIEFLMGLRWIHLIQEGTLFLYRPNGTVFGRVPTAELNFRTGFLDYNDHIEGLTQGAFRQGNAKNDYNADPEIVNRGFGYLQKVLDICTNDLAKSRQNGFQPYVKYLELCRNKKYDSFDSLIDVMDESNIEQLKLYYENVEDIDLIAGIWMEKLMDGSYAPETLFCFAKDQFLRTIKTDRHWYERPNRPHAFTEAQLKEVRKASMSQILCDHGDSVTQIQKNSFKTISDTNPLLDCSQIAKINLNAWKE